MVRDPETPVDITSLLNKRWVANVRPVSFVISGLIVVVGVLVLIGWRFHIPFLESVSPQWVKTRPMVALALIFSGISLGLQLEPGLPEFRGRIFLGKTFGIFVGIIGVSELYSTIGLQPVAPVAPVTAVTLMLVGFALASLTKHTNKHPISHTLAFLVMFISTLPAVGYLYGTPFQTRFGLYWDMALPTSVTCLLIGFGILFNRIDHDLAAVLVSIGPGGSLARRLLPASTLVLVLLGWIRVEGERYQYFSFPFGTAAFTTAALAVVCALIWQQSVVLQRAEIRRRRMLDEQEGLRIEGELRDQFISMMSHDLRTPLTAATLQSQFISRRASDLETCKKGALNIERMLRKAEDLIRDLLDASQIRAGHALPLRVQHCDLAEVLDAALLDLSLIYGDRFVAAWNHPIDGYWDPRAVARIVENLCGNAVKYGSKNAPIHVLVEEIGSHLHIRVRNEGNEIAIEDQQRLFNLFQRASQENKEAPGWGIGLALVRGIAEAHGGKVWVESGMGSGTTFTVELPRDSRQAMSA